VDAEDFVDILEWDGLEEEDKRGVDAIFQGVNLGAVF